VIVSGASGGFGPAPGSPVAVGPLPYSVASTDVNADGHPDLVTANEGDATVSVLLGDGHGNFSAAAGSPHTVGGEPAAFVADVNGDHHPDIVSPNFSDNNLTVLLGDGHGGFSFKALVSTGAEPYSAGIGDLNGDGHPDLAVPNFGDSTVSILLGNGQGGFNPALDPTVPAGAGPSGIAVADLNHDAHLDLVVTNSGSGTVSVLLGDGQGAFFPTGPAVAVGAGPTWVSAADFNGDGRLDLAVANSGGSSVSILLGDGQGGFSEAAESPQTVGDNPTAIAVADLNHDSRPDLAVGSFTGATVSLLLGNGHGGFSSSVTSPLEAGSKTDWVSAADVNGDGRPDLAITNSEASSVSVFLNTGGAAPTVSSFSPASGAAGLVVTIAGTHLDRVSEVDFNGRPAAFTSSSIQIVATAPDGVTSGKLTMIGDTGAATSAASFTVVPRPVIGSFAPADGQAATPVTITGVNFTGATSVKFGTVTDSTFHVDSTTQITAHVPAGFSTGKISVTGPPGTGTSVGAFSVSKAAGISPLAAAAGATVTITGQGLGSTTSVDFDGHSGVLPASPPTATTVKVVVPNDATVGTLTVNTPRANPDTPVFKPLPKIASLSPTGGVAGQTVQIVGTNLSGAAVKFGTVPAASVTPVSATEVDATAPGLPFSSGKITVTTLGGQAVSPQTFQISKVTALSPTSGAFGTVVTITGQGLGSTSSVDFPGATGAIPTSVSATSVKVPLPATAFEGPLTVHVIGGALTTAAFKPLPKITGFSPSTAQAGDPIVITGTNLLATALDVPSFKLGAVPIVTPLVLPTAAFATVPLTGLTALVAVVNGDGTATSPAKLDVEPTITGDPAPNHGVAGTTIVLTGETFSGTTRVTFGNNASVPFTLGGGGTMLIVKVPATATTGPISVTNAGGTTQTDHDFVIDPTITSFTPTTAGQGAKITLTGAGFGSATQARTISVGSTTVTSVNYVSPTSLTFQIPNGAPASGAIGISVDGGTTAVSANTLTVTATVVSFTPDHGVPATTQVTITGAGFTDVTAVLFGDTPAVVFHVDSATQITVTVPSGAADGPIRVIRSSAPASLTSATSFTVQHALTIDPSGTGSGTVTSLPLGIDCGGTCSALFHTGTIVTLSAGAATGSTFTGWSGGGCTGTGTCDVTIDAAKEITATFTLNQYTLTLAIVADPDTTRSVASVPDGISCSNVGGTCSAEFDYGTVITLNATPGADFGVWDDSSGACYALVSPTCEFTINGDVTITALFRG
jgi:hypothetical protein